MQKTQISVECYKLFHCVFGDKFAAEKYLVCCMLLQSILFHVLVLLPSCHVQHFCLPLLMCHYSHLEQYIQLETALNVLWRRDNYLNYLIWRILLCRMHDWKDT